MSMVALQALIPTLLLTALVLAAAMQGLAASGHFPRAAQPRSGSGPIVLFGSMALTFASLAGGAAAALRFIPWYAAIIGAGLSVLAAPLLLQWFSDRFVDGRGALLALAGASAVLAMLLIGRAV